MSFFAELRNRKLVQWLLAYAAGAWVMLQVLSLLIGAYHWPDSVLRIAIGMAVVGFFITAVLAWYHGERGVQRATRAEISLLAAIAVIGALGTWLGERGRAAPEAATPGTAASAVATPPTKTTAAKSIAVLPFVSMSSEVDNEFFSDGLSEEILNSLARIDGMQVVGRTSSFQFKGKNEDLRSVGEKLGVASVLEGSVRRDGERARITAQLIRTNDGFHLWSQTYDRTLKDTLAVQLDIAEKVAGALNVLLDDKQRVRMREDGVENIDAFIAYQKGMKLYDDAHDPKKNRDVVEGLRRANVEFAKAVALEPDFAQAYFVSADLFNHLLLSDNHSPAERIEAQREGMRVYGLSAEHSRDAQLRLLALAEQQMLSDNWHGLADKIDAALKQPGCRNPDWLPVLAAAFGYVDGIEDLGKRTSECDPLNSINYNSRIRAALAAGRGQQALDVATAAATAFGRGPLRRPPPLASLMLGKFDEAKATLDAAEVPEEGYYKSAVIVGTVTGETAASIQARLQRVDRSTSIYHLWNNAEAVAAAWSGNRAEANRLAAILDARPAGPFLLAVLTTDCLCGAPFDLDATPNFKARLAESGLPWPPHAVVFPGRDAGAKP